MKDEAKNPKMLEASPASPACGGRLSERVLTDGRELWCGNKDCQSLAAENGAKARTPAEALALLAECVKAERDRDIAEMGRTAG